MDQDDETLADLLATMIEGIMQAQEAMAASLVIQGVLDKAALQARLDTLLEKELRLGAQVPLLRLREVLKGRPPPAPPWRPKVIRGGRDDPGPTE